MIEDQYTKQARLDMKQAWGYPPDSQWICGTERAHWQYAMEQRAARLRAEAALRAAGLEEPSG
jgi:hypothetical protein